MSACNLDIPQQTFLGATVQSFSAQLGWNEQPTTVTINLVEDTCNGDNFNPIALGAPTLFQFGETGNKFKFAGILTRWVANDPDATDVNTYTVTLMSPQELLQGTQVILSGYGGAITTPNVFNVYGYLESFGGCDLNLGTVADGTIFGTLSKGYGGAGQTEAGIRWSDIRTALAALTDRVIGPFPQDGTFNPANAITFIAANGTSVHNYGLDLSEIPVPLAAADYRIPGDTTDILTLIGQVCNDLAHDYFVELSEDLSTIKIRTVSRVNQPATGLIANFIASQTAAGREVITSSYGQELRNETAQNIIIGGQKRSLYQVTNGVPWPGTDPDDLTLPPSTYLRDTVVPYYGRDFFGNIYYVKDNGYITVSLLGIKASLPNISSLLPDSVEVHFRTINLAGKGFSDWLRDLEFFRDSALTPIIQKIAPGLHSPVGRAALLGDNPNLKARDLVPFGSFRTSEAIWFELEALHKFFADMDQKSKTQLMVRIPATCAQLIDIVDGKIITSDNPTDGGWTEESFVLGLPTTGGAISYFKNEDGTIPALGAYPYTGGIDFTRLDTDKYFYNGNEDSGVFYTELQAQKELVFFNKSTAFSPRVILDAPNLTPALIPSTDEFDAEAQNAEIQARLGNWDQVLPTGEVEPEIFRYVPRDYILEPQAIAIPFVSNTVTYGPWQSSTVLGVGVGFGRTNIEKDDTLVPWSYGGVAQMNDIAQAKVNAGVSNMRTSENGEVTFAGVPTDSLGSLVVAGGPNLTSINMQVGIAGLQTTYFFRTYTHKFGFLAKQNANVLAERYKNINKIQNRIALYNKLQTISAANSQKFNKKNKGGGGKAGRIEKFSGEEKLTKNAPPHGIMVGAMAPAIDGTGNRTLVTNKSIFSAGNNTEGEHYDRTAMMSMDGAVRPVSLGGSGGLPRLMVAATTGEFDSTKIHNRFFNFLGNPSGEFSELTGMHTGESHGHDIDMVARGTYAEITGLLEATGTGGEYLNSFSLCLSSNVRNKEIVTDYADDYRFMAHRGPIFIHGWGYDLDGKPVPNEADSEDAAGSGEFTSENLTDKFLPNWQKKPHTWPLAPLDVRLDRERGVWSAVGGGGVSTATRIGLLVDDPLGFSWSDRQAFPKKLRTIPVEYTETSGIGSYSYNDFADFDYVVPREGAAFDLAAGECGDTCETIGTAFGGLLISTPIGTDNLIKDSEAGNLVIQGTGAAAQSTITGRIISSSGADIPLTITNNNNGTWQSNPVNISSSVYGLKRIEVQETLLGDLNPQAPKYIGFWYAKGYNTSDLQSQRFGFFQHPVPNLLTSSDTGASNSDKITSLTNPEFEVIRTNDTLPEANGPKLRVLVDGVEDQYLGVNASNNLTGSVALVNGLSEGFHAIQFQWNLEGQAFAGAPDTDTPGQPSNPEYILIDYSETGSPVISSGAVVNQFYGKTCEITKIGNTEFLMNPGPCPIKLTPYLSDRVANYITLRINASADFTDANNVISVDDTSAVILNPTTEPNPAVDTNILNNDISPLAGSTGDLLLARWDSDLEDWILRENRG